MNKASSKPVTSRKTLITSVFTTVSGSFTSRKTWAKQTLGTATNVCSTNKPWRRSSYTTCRQYWLSTSNDSEAITPSKTCTLSFRRRVSTWVTMLWVTSKRIRSPFTICSQSVTTSVSYKPGTTLRLLRTETNGTSSTIIRSKLWMSKTSLLHLPTSCSTKDVALTSVHSTTKTLETLFRVSFKRLAKSHQDLCKKQEALDLL